MSLSRLLSGRHSGLVMATTGLLALAPLTAVHAAEVIRTPIPNSDFPIARAVEVPAGLAMVHLSGAGPSVADKTAPPNSIASFGNTQAQTVSTLKAIEATLASLKLTLGDVVRMQVFLVGDPAQGGEMDFAGFMAGYRQFFGTAAQPKLPVRSTMKVAGLANPGWLVEIEVSAARPAP